MDICHWLAGEAPQTQCCEFMNDEKECLDCVTEGGPEAGGRIRWHASFFCPFCRGIGVPINNGR